MKQRFGEVAGWLLYLQRTGCNGVKKFMDNTQIILNSLLSKYNVQIVGRGYAECIVKAENALAFIDELSAMKISIKSVTWWCHCNNQNKEKYGCPHGGGGPVSEYYEGHFSEMYHMPEKVVACNEEAKEYITNEVKRENFYSPCIDPAFWLDVPDEWKNPKGEDRMPLV